MLGTADSTIYYRVKKMIDKGIIEKFTKEVDSDQLGKVSSFLRIDITPRSLENVLKTLLEMAEIDEIYETHERSELIVKISASHLDQIRTFILRVRKLPYIVSTELNTILKKRQKPTV